MDTASKSTEDDEVEFGADGSNSPAATATSVEAPLDVSHLATPTQAPPPVEVGDGAGASVGQQGPGRLSTLVPTLGRMAIRAQKASVPYVTYAAMASQEAARYEFFYGFSPMLKVFCQSMLLLLLSSH